MVRSLHETGQHEARGELATDLTGHGVAVLDRTIRPELPLALLFGQIEGGERDAVAHNEFAPLVEGLHRSGRLAGSHAVAAVLANLYACTGAEAESRRFLEEALASARTRHERRLIALQVGRARDSYAGGSKTG